MLQSMIISSSFCFWDQLTQEDPLSGQLSWVKILSVFSLVINSTSTYGVVIQCQELILQMNVFLNPDMSYMGVGGGKNHLLLDIHGIFALTHSILWRRYIPNF